MCAAGNRMPRIQPFAGVEPFGNIFDGTVLSFYGLSSYPIISAPSIAVSIIGIDYLGNSRNLDAHG